ncbi:hypothetical protein Tco_1546602 [Tanacetum coccineum]
MSSESTSLGTPQCLLTPSSKVKFQHHESIIAYNNVVALLEHHEPLFKPMLSFLLNYSICTSLTKEPSTMYVEYLKDFWYTAEVDDATKDISFSLSFFKNQLSFTRFDFLTAIGLTDSKTVVPLPPKGTVRAGLATLGLADKDKPSLTSTELNNFWENYHDESLTVLKPHHISAASFQTPSASEVSLTSLMLKVAKLSKKPEEYLILPSEEVNDEESADKSQSGTNVQPLSQPKAPTAKKSKKKKIPSSTQPKVSNDSREVNPPSTTTHLQATEELVVTAVPIQSLEASVTAEVQNNQLKAADATKFMHVPEQIVKKEEVAEEQTLEIPSLEQLLEEVDNHNQADQTTSESPYDTESEIKVVKSFLTSHLSELHDQTMNNYEVLADIHDKSDSDLHSMPDNELRTVLEFETIDSDDFHDNDVSTSDYVVQNDYASAERLSLPDHMDHICKEVSFLHSRLEDLEFSIAQKVSDEIQSSLPALVTNALKKQLPGILSATLKDCLPLLIKESLQTHIPATSEYNRFVTLQKELSKVIKSEVAKKVQVVGLDGVREDLQSQTMHISKYCSSFQNMQTQLQDVKDLLKSAGEHKTAKNITQPEPSPETQGELAYKESTLPVSKTKVNKESTMVLYESEKKDLVDLTTEQDSEDDDDLDKQPLSKRFKIMHPILSKPQPSVKQFTDQLFGITSLKFSPTLPIEPTPPRDESKGKGIATEEQPKDIMPFCWDSRFDETK